MFVPLFLSGPLGLASYISVAAEQLEHTGNVLLKAHALKQRPMGTVTAAKCVMEIHAKVIKLLANC